MALKARVWNMRSSPPRMMYFGKDFYVLSCKHGSWRIKESPENKDFELHILTNEFFRKDMPSCQGEVILMLCTGIKDKNGKEVYVGDILNLRYKDKEPNVIVLRNLIVDTYWISDELGFKDSTVEIIGNIYENPELLKEKQ